MTSPSPVTSLPKGSSILPAYSGGGFQANSRSKALKSPRQSDVDYWGEFSNSFKGSMADAFVVLSNAAGVVQNAAAKLSEKTGIDMPTAIGDVKNELRSWADSIAPDPSEFANPKGLADKIAVGLTRAVGAAVPAAGLYGAATLATRSPARGMALVEALRETDKGAFEMAVAGLRGLVMGKSLDLASSMPNIAKRTALGGSVMGFQSLLAGHPKEQVLVDVITGGLLAAPLGAREKAKVSGAMPSAAEMALPPDVLPATPPSRNVVRTASGVTVTTPIEGISHLGAYVQSPSVMFERFPKTSRAIEKAMEAELVIRDEAARDLPIAQRAFRSIPKQERSRIIELLGDPSVTVLQFPTSFPGVSAKTAAKYKAAYRDLRTILEKRRQLNIETKRLTGKDVDQHWGIEDGYWMHEFRGPWEVLVDGKPVPDGWLQMTRRKAVRKANEWKALQPDSRVEVLYMDGVKPNLPKKVMANERYWARVQMRKENLPGWVDNESAMYNYIRESERYNRISRVRPFAKEARNELIELFGENGHEVKVWDRYWDSVEGRPGNLVKFINKRAAMWGFSPNVTQRTLGFAQSLEAVLKLGASPVAATNNLFQTIANTVPVLGMKYTERGIRGFVSGKYDWLLERMAIKTHATKSEFELSRDYLRMYRPEIPRSLREVPAAVADLGAFTWNSSSALAMMMFQKSENANRSVAAIGAYLRAIDKGKSFQEATRMAENVVRRTQFHYGNADSPIIFATQFGRTLFQFKTFMLKQLEFMWGLGKSGDRAGRFDPRWKEVSRFAGLALTSVGLAGVPGMEMLDWTIEKLTGQSPFSDWLQEHPRIARGYIGSAYGIDTQMLGYGDWPVDPNWVGVTKFTGPLVNDLYNLFAAGAANKGADKEVAVKQAWRQASPVARRLYDSFLSQASNRGEVRTIRGRVVLSDLTATEKMLKAMGWRPLREAAAQHEIGRLLDQRDKERSLAAGFNNRLADAVESGDKEEFKKVVKDAFEHGFLVSGKSVKMKLRSRATTMLEELNRQPRNMIPQENR